MSLNLSWPATTMRAVVYHGTPFEMMVQDVAKPTILNETDVVVRVTTSAMCGSDLHIYRGYMGGAPPWTMGHEAVGYISEIGDAVSSFAVGDYVIVPDTVSVDHLEIEPTSKEYFGFGNSEIGLGGLQGRIAEYARVPFAEANLIPIPLTQETANSTIEHDYLTVADIFATGWAGIDYTGFESGDSVAVFGAGPVGLLSAYSAILRGASKVYVVDHVEERLGLAASIGAIPINFAHKDPVAQILAREPRGVMRTVDCVGMEALNPGLEMDESIVLQQMIDVAHFGGGIGQLGVYQSQESSPGAPYGSNISPTIPFSVSTFFAKSLSFRAGAVDPKQYAPQLIDLITSGKAHPSFVISAVIGIEDASRYYKRFDAKTETKVAIYFPE
ncbi:alcohol dehydrogenase GroES-like domain-containing protein [Colletotrichum limetticola]|uniref:Alcohol dehydrogenase GroES-like domain-containing protein n=1 Tax=Colletotrichum limetticola TaxID=1209924 RepID=A0ABQ9PFW6_9PEZI|nr:alcohol dehydrogenase GroES-like domain-containing protein [Colletotrichum limetticola]